jgi:hypothetical protein
MSVLDYLCQLYLAAGGDAEKLAALLEEQCKGSTDA